MRTDAVKLDGNIHIVIIADRVADVGELSHILEQVCPVRLLPPAVNPLMIGEATLCVVLDANLSSDATFEELTPVRNLIVERGIPCLLLVDNSLDDDALLKSLNRAEMFGVVNYVSRPFIEDEILRILPPFNRPMAAIANDEKSHRETVLIAANQTASDLLKSAIEKRPDSFARIVESDELILDALSTWGIKPWMDTVRRHHNGTYKHCLLVTGFAVVLSRAFNARVEDQRRVARAGLLHDIGKAFIPVAILDKPGKITKEETEVVRKHPMLGHDLLVQCGGFPNEILDCVLHHHEMLDGSGYPHGLKGNQITDLVRIVTIADIFSALIERRAYREPLPADKAFQIMKQMGQKLDPDLMRLFETVVEQAR